VDPTREFYPAGQGVGAINELVPAGELVRRIVREAEGVLSRIGKLPAR
jgi:enoyl-[acyl-carrier protein] reductase II